MIFDDLKRVYALVGEITTEFNNLEQLWYLIFTCLLYRAPRSAIDAVFEQHKTGGGQRKMIVDVALARKAEVERIGGPNDKAILIPVFDAISNLSKVTNELAGRRNHVMHSLIGIHQLFDGAASIKASGIASKPSGLAGKEVEAELVALLADIEHHALDLEQLRIDSIVATNPDIDVSRERQTLGHLRQLVAAKHPRTE